MNERLKFQGRLQEKRMDAERLRLRLIGLRDALRDKLDPFEDVFDIDGDVIASEALEFAKTQGGYRAALAVIESIKKALGREE